MVKLFTFFIFSIWGLCLNAQTQTELTNDSFTNLRNTENRLNEIIVQLSKQYASDSIFIDKLQNSQKNWLLFRDSELELRYPSNSYVYIGSVFPMCKNLYLSELTQERIEKLSLWLTGIEEGDVCLGSVKMKPVENSFNADNSNNYLVPDSATAIKIAEPILINIYGKVKIENQKPFAISSTKETWIIEGTLGNGLRGGVAKIIIQKRDAKIVSINHGK